jgi:outer membrane immunogenic protein
MKLLLAAAIGIAAPAAALAADVSMFRPSAPAAFDWSGAYFGGHIGGGWSKTIFSDSSSGAVIQNFTDNIGFASGPPTQTINSSSFLGGLQAGANYQIGRLVLGTELDISWTSLSGSNSVALPSDGTPGSFDVETVGNRTKWTGTSTTRLGVTRDTWMFYGKAGAAWASNTYSLAHVGASNAIAGGGAFTGPFAFAASASDIRVGWTVGTGIEWAFSRNWTTKLEYDYLDFGTKAESFSGVFAGPGKFANLPVNGEQHISQLKWGINYKLDPGFLFW